MEIKRPDIINLINKIYQQDKVRGKVAPAEAPGISCSDRLEISAGSEVLKKEMARLQGADPSRMGKIAELTRQIEAGEYKVDPRELADIMLRTKKDEQG